MKKISLLVLLPLVLCTSCYTFWKHKHHHDSKPQVITVLPVAPEPVAPKEQLPWDPGLEPQKLPSDLENHEHS